MFAGPSALHTGVRFTHRMDTLTACAGEAGKAGTHLTVVTCSRCKATYPIDLDAFGEGQQVRCTNCGHEWYQTSDRLRELPDDMELIPYPAEMKARVDAGEPAEAQARFRAFVGNLAFTCSETELRAAFEVFGKVVSTTVMTDNEGRPRGFGFVNMESEADGKRAVEELDGMELHGRSISVSVGKQPAGRDGGRGRGRGDGRGRGGGRGRGRFTGDNGEVVAPDA